MCDILVSKLLGFETFPIFLMVSESVSKKFGIEKSFGFRFVQILGDVSVLKLLGFETFPFLRWFRIRYRKKLVSKKYWIQYRKNLVSGPTDLLTGVKCRATSVSFRFWVSSRTGPIGPWILCLGSRDPRLRDLLSSSAVQNSWRNRSNYPPNAAKAELFYTS